MERRDIRERPPHFAEFIIGPAEGRTRWLNAGYRFSPASPRRAQI